MRSDKTELTEAVTNDELRMRVGQTDWARLDAMTDEDIARGKRLEEEEIEAEFGPMRRGPDAFGPVRVVVAGPDVRALRERTGLSQEEFADRFGLSLRTLQQWEQRRRVPDGPARLLLRLIELDPQAVERAAHVE